MNAELFRKNWENLSRENLIWRYVSIGQVIVMVILAYAVVHRDEIVVLSPPDLSEQVEISRSKASLAYRKSFAMYLAMLGGNVTPGNVVIIKEAIGPLLAPSIYRTVMDNIEQQINALRIDRITLEYTPKAILYEPETDKIFVSGTQVSRGPSGKPETNRRTYEFIIEMQNYRPVLVHAVAYTGNPKTLKTLKSSGEDQWTN